VAANPELRAIANPSLREHLADAQATALGTEPADAMRVKD
jgi:hypothetical protein